MKRRSREISIFSMSALDLFASALGAFILIAIVIFPYFPNTSRSPVVVVAATPDCPPVVPCPPAPPAPPAPSPPTPAPPAPPAAQFPHLDLIVALDVSGSMGDQIAGLRAEVNQLSSVMMGLTPSLGMGVVAFGDRNWDRPITTFPLREISGSTTNQSAFQEFVAELRTNMGLGGGYNDDNPEAFREALTEAARMNWRARAELRIIVLITDNPAYPEESDQAVAEARSFAATGNARVSTVFRDTNSDSGSRAFLERVANAGRGQFVEDTGGSFTVTLLLSML